MNTILILILGGTGSGKNHLANELHRYIDDSNLIVYDTTRPKRDNEKDGVDYNFINGNTFRENSYICTAYYNNWYYGVREESIEPNKVNILVGNDVYINSLIKYFGKENIICIYTLTPDKIRLLNCLNREEAPDCKEICRRFLSDSDNGEYIDNLWNIFEDNFHRYNYTRDSIADLLFEIEK